MPIRLSTYAYRDRRRPGEGLRLGCARYLVRGVRKKEYAGLDIMDVWLPILAPSKELVAWAKKRDLADARVWNTYIRRYRAEMKQTNARQAIRTMAKLAERTPISVGCYCQGGQCHRFELERMIRAAAAGRF